MMKRKMIIAAVALVVALLGAFSANCIVQNNPTVQMMDPIHPGLFRVPASDLNAIKASIAKAKSCHAFPTEEETFYLNTAHRMVIESETARFQSERLMDAQVKSMKYVAFKYARLACGESEG